MKEKIVQSQSGKVSLFTQSFGSPNDPAALLVMGATASMLWWDAEFCKRLANQGFLVIRYDNRDTGRSTSYAPGAPPYSVTDLADDALAILNAYQMQQANCVGMSLGGMISQIIAISHPERVSSLSLLSTSVWDNRPELPSIEGKILNHFSNAVNIDWKARKSVADYLVEAWRLQNGSGRPFDADRARRLAEAEFDRSPNLLSSFNHAQLTGGEALYGHSRRIRVPTVVIHGDNDPVLPIAHGKTLQATIANSHLVTLAGAGHEIHVDDWDTIIKSITGVARTRH